MTKPFTEFQLLGMTLFSVPNRNYFSEPLGLVVNSHKI